ncbi:MAG: diguanylate cyclase [Burkholderiales bacterium]|nr:diguanylate cyclase [Burkholderiales bacterium]
MKLRPSSILLVDDNPGMIQVMGRMLSGLGELRFATSGATALQQLRAAAPDLVLLDAEMPGMSGYDVCEAMKAEPALADIPVIFVTAHSDTDFELKGLEAGAVDFIAKPVSEALLLARVRTQLRIKHLTDELRNIASIDGLTGVVNRRGFEESLQREWLAAMRDGTPMSLLLIDVDHFKLYNDRYGHPAGDACLRSVAQAMRDKLQRPGDLVARYGGEEFVVLLSRTPRAGAEHVAHRMLDAVEALGISHESSPTSGHLTVSIGIGCYDTDSACWIEQSGESRLVSTPQHGASDLVRSADLALYAAKGGGRAQAWRLDLGDVDSPSLAREIAPQSRLPQSRLAA